MKTNLIRSQFPFLFGVPPSAFAARRPSGGPGRADAELRTASRAPLSVAKLAFLCLLAACCLAIPAHAGVVVVTSLDDDGSAGTLRAVIAAAAPGDSISFDVTGTIRLAGEQLIIDKDLTIAGPGAAQLAVNGNAASRVFRIGPGINVTIAGLTITNAFTTGGSPLDHGAGILNDHSTLTVSNCTLSGNSSSSFGGGLFNDGSSGSATLTVVNSTLSGNSAFGGGGIYNYGRLGSATVTVINSTLSGNSATYGGGINSSGSSGSATLTVANSTLSGNSANSSGGGIFNGGFSGSATVEIGSTILNASGIGNERGTVTSDGYNLSSDSGGGFLNQPTDQINTDPKLGLLQLNGGQTPTHALLCGSPAIDSGTNFPDLATDQRGDGFARTIDVTGVAHVGDGTDIGAYEAQTPPVCNQPPVAQCRDVTVSADANCSATASIDNGSDDPDGDTINVSQSPAGPYPLGQTSVTLTVTDSHGASSSCAATVTVVDDTPPTVPSCPADAIIECPAAPAFGTPRFSDTCDNNPNVTSFDASLSIGGKEISKTRRTWMAADLSGNSVSCSQTITVVDTTAPTLTCPTDVTVITTSASGMKVTYPTATASDNCSTPTITYSKASDSMFNLGTTTVTVTATDAKGNSAQGTFKVNVIYSWSSVLQPINADGSSVFKLGTTVQVKFQLTGASAGIANAVAKLSYTKLPISIPPGPVNEATSTAAATSGNLFRYDAKTKQYVFNWGTKGLTTGTYQVSLDLGDGVARTVNVTSK